MAKFKFRLETLHQLRIREAVEAKLAFIQAQRARFEMEDYLVELALKRRESISGEPSQTYADRVSLQAWMDSLDLQQQHAEAALTVLLDEEEACQHIWHQCQQAADALEKLREHHKQEFDLEQSRKEQSELDEWAVLRRTA